MAIIISQSEFNVVEMLAPRIEVQWDFRTNSGPVLFYFDRVDWDGKAYVNERHYHSTVRGEIADMIQGTYKITHPVTGEEIEEPAWKLMLLVKAATDRVWYEAHAPKPELTPEEPEPETPEEADGDEPEQETPTAPDHPIEPEGEQGETPAE